VLTSLQQVEDDIATLRVLEQRGVIEDATVKAAREAETLTLNQYKAGAVPYSSVITAQTTRLNSEENALNVLSGRLQASVAIIQGLGGGWNAFDIEVTRAGGPISRNQPQSCDLGRCPKRLGGPSNPSPAHIHPEPVQAVQTRGNGCWKRTNRFHGQNCPP